MKGLVDLEKYRKNKKTKNKNIYFSRKELMSLMQLYSTHVAKNEWRDYAIDHIQNMAIFSVFRHSKEQPQYSISKTSQPKNNPPLFIAYQGQKRLLQSPKIDRIIDYIKTRPRSIKP